MTDTKKLSFSDYLKSKEVLREATNNAPQETSKYRVNKYCRLPVKDDTKTHLRLKPDHTLLVEWLHDNPDCPTPIGLRTENDSTGQQSKWSGDRLLKWLLKNTKKL